MLARAALPGMVERGRGAVINVASLLAFSGGMPSRPDMGRAVYASTKAYLVAFSRILAGELGPGSPVRVQVVCPGITATEFHLTRGPLGRGRHPARGRSRDAGTRRGDRVPRGAAHGRGRLLPGLADAAAVEVRNPTHLNGIPDSED